MKPFWISGRRRGQILPEMTTRIFTLASLLFIGLAMNAQTPGTPERHALTSFDNSFANTLPVPVYDRNGHDANRYGFQAMFEIRVAPGVVKTLEVRQYFATEQLSVQGFMKVRTAMPGQAELVYVTWISPTQGGGAVGN